VLKDVSFSVTAIPQLVLGFMIRDKHGHVVWGSNTAHTRQVQENLKSGETIIFRLAFTCALGPGSYSVSPALSSSDTHLAHNYEWVDNMLVFDVVNVQHDFFIGSNWLNARFFIIR
jgi:lipopolysaccharide transport system ATP-binding protein